VAAEGLRLRRARRQLNEELRRVQEQRSALRELRQERGAFRSEVGEQRARLTSLGLLGEVGDGDACPVCAQPLPHPDPVTAALRQQIVELDQRLANEKALQPPRRRIASELRARAEELRARLRRTDGALAAIAGDAAEFDAGVAERRAFVRGRIAQFVDGLRAAEPGRQTLLERRVRELEAEIAGLEDALDPTAVARQVESRLHYVNESITSWAQQLGLEHSEDGVRLDVGNLTIVANSRRGPIPLHRIGSAENQVGYHVVTHLALHRWFVEEDRPVPVSYSWINLSRRTTQKTCLRD
jgi:DNA repair exonuclease SbcCD ATPase subunit